MFVIRVLILLPNTDFFDHLTLLILSNFKHYHLGQSSFEFLHFLNAQTVYIPYVCTNIASCHIFFVNIANICKKRKMFTERFLVDISSSSQSVTPGTFYMCVCLFCFFNLYLSYYGSDFYEICLTYDKSLDFVLFILCL